jgi:DNA polymerase III subunit chi
MAEKAWSQQYQVYVHAPDAHSANNLDQLMWTFRAGSFVPHQLAGESATDCPVQIGYGAEPESGYQVLINLDEEVPLFFSRFERVVEIVNLDEKVRQAGRNRFKFYRDRGYDLYSHNLDG